LVSVVVVPITVHVPDESTLWNVMDLPEREVVPALRVPERVKDWLAAGLLLVVVMVMEVGVVAVAAPALVEADEAALTPSRVA